MTKILRLPLSKLKANPANARSHSEEQIERLADSLTRFGQQKPIVIDAENVVRCGNGTFAAARSMGWKSIECVRTELTGAQLKAYEIADNRLADLSAFDADALAEAIKEDDLSLDSIGFEPDELRELMQQMEAEDRGKPDEEGDQAGRCKPIIVTPNQREVIERGIEKIREQAGEGPPLSEGGAIELLCADWLSGK